MKRITPRERLKDVFRSFKHRTKCNNKKKRYRHSPTNKISKNEYKPIVDYIDTAITTGLRAQAQNNRKNGIIIYLPEVMDFEENYHLTVLHLDAIGKLVSLLNKNGGRVLPRGAYNLASVNFDALRCISTEAALALTAEISNWEDSVRNKLRPSIKQWDEAIYSQFHDLGFFDLFQNKPLKKPLVNQYASEKKLVKYQKADCNRKGATRILRDSIHELVGNDIDTWTFLHSGLEEAITNVGHHAYPAECELRPKEKCWYLTASYIKRKKELKIAFFDQGVGIPNTLETSKLKEKVDFYIAKISRSRKKLDETLLEAAIEVGRTSTGDPDRGNGLPDLLEFIRKTGNGELNIFSGFGHYKLTVTDYNEKQHTSRLPLAMQGTLIVWSVTL
ncbi:hypothetical protein [Photobacterium damselae]|uniref:Uncharacterized protein n=1 Tax=Photobacterium damselae subsp. damselae TaxID=85581 RepID=A0AAD3WY00_PHODD|nr:hypothetical protein [Photobacterium damselae]KAB1183562.1 hypothetical protein F6450_03765 [Photobacterium damselae subsp. damselae]UKA01589.1 hypothetical protein IHC89_13190 [Photobacterium damselae subsp. damselae]